MRDSVLETSDSYDRIKEFMRGAGQPTPESYHELTEAERVIRARLILEETLETIVLGLGVQVGVRGLHDVVQISRPENGGKFMEQFVLNAEWEYDPVEFVDGVVDIHVVSRGSLIAAGIPDEAFQEEVDDNNLLKIANGHLNEHGKLVKPVGHPAPNISGILEAVKKAQRQS
jgi:predicted HAD superfamily Cof-like phosphohydrolase